MDLNVIELSVHHIHLPHASLTSTCLSVLSLRVLTGNFSDVNKYNCKGCQDGYLTEALVTQRFWSYVQLPIDGMRSMVFHGPSPTLCVASGE